MLPYKTGIMRVTSPFGWRMLNGVREYHRGIDLVGTDKTIAAIAGGIVGVSMIITDPDNLTSQWGNYIRIDTDCGLKMYYCHLSRRIAEAGQRVEAGDIIGIEGCTGYSFGSHLHLEIRNSAGATLDPSDFLGIPNEPGAYPCPLAANQSQSYADLVCQKCGLEPQTKAYLNEYKYSAELWRKLWEATKTTEKTEDEKNEG